MKMENGRTSALGMAPFLLVTAFGVAAAACAAPLERTIAPPTGEVQAQPAPVTTKGVIASIERDGTLVVMTAERKAVVMHLRSDSEISRDGKAAQNSELKVGDAATATHLPGGQVKSLEATERDIQLK